MHRRRKAAATAAAAVLVFIRSRLRRVYYSVHRFRKSRNPLPFSVLHLYPLPTLSTSNLQRLISILLVSSFCTLFAIVDDQLGAVLYVRV